MPGAREERLDMDALAESDRIERQQQRELREGIDRIFGDSKQAIKERAGAIMVPALLF